MYTATVCRLGKPLAIHLYKHRDTRRYLNLDDGGHAYAYRGPNAGDDDFVSGGRYRRHATLIDAITNLDLWLFEAERPLWRSFPPDEWPYDLATR